MILLALLLASVGAADLTRPQDRAAARLAVLRAVAIGTAVLILGVWGTGLQWWWVPVGAALLAGWTTTTPERPGSRRWPSLSSPWPPWH